MKAFDKTLAKYGVEAYPYYYGDDSYGRIIVKDHLQMIYMKTPCLELSLK
ncbi:hypothetical protein AAAC51_45560 [Priestia megaterium]